MSWRLVFGIVFAFAIGSYLARSTDTPSQTVTTTGVSACAGCHGQAHAASLTAPTDDQTWRSSLTHFLAVDPHRNAFAVLSNERSKRITTHLQKHSPDVIPEAVRDTRCLACHVTPQAIEDKSFQHESIHGIGCESCHGQASKWLTAHTTWTSATRAAGIDATGFVDLNRADVRLQTCAGCHIGAKAGKGLPVRDMNHDMIAAGHPALPESLDELLKRYPRHWHERTRGTPIDIKVSDIERIAKSILSNDRKTRAEAKDSRTPWPELAEQSCQSCHQSVNPLRSREGPVPDHPNKSN